MKQSKGFGAMISFEVENEQTAVKILERVKIAMYAESLGGVETLITYPMLQTHADVPKNEREAKGINERLLRLSVGLENIDDIIDDFTQALEGDTCMTE
jgi:cystathionine gamma-synthase